MEDTVANHNSLLQLIATTYNDSKRPSYYFSIPRNFVATHPMYLRGALYLLICFLIPIMIFGACTSSEGDVQRKRISLGNSGFNLEVEDTYEVTLASEDGRSFRIANRPSIGSAIFYVVTGDYPNKKDWLNKIFNDENKILKTTEIEVENLQGLLIDLKYNESDAEIVTTKAMMLTDGDSFIYITLVSPNSHATIQYSYNRFDEMIESITLHE